MGLLDDAIREHLELKRLRGTDPGVVAREEQDALGPTGREGEVGRDRQEGAGTGTSLDAGGSSFPDPESARGAGLAPPGQETIEINAVAELSAGGDPGHEPEAIPPERAAPAAHPAHAQPPAEESLAWDAPDDRSRESEEGPESHDDVDSYAGDGHEAAEHLEDVLEETPDFLRDTPEQERLWFEQRPPRDFDFNE